MGKSNELVFNWYLEKLPDGAKRIAVLGSTHESFVRQKYPGASIDLYDIQLGNWNINDDVWEIEDDVYDLVVMTRCAYFSNDPKLLIEKCFRLLQSGGKLFIDWGLGDHWRFPTFKVGWKYDDVHEYAVYANQKNYLYSCVWCDKWSKEPCIQEFVELISPFGYKDMSITDIIRSEVPALLEDPPDLHHVHLLTAWPEAPQLYILTVFVKP